jgi:1,2-diacylglycerol 3-alpha-glucosyltransferase
MNIALFSDTYLPIKTGVVTVMLQLKNGLEKRGHNVFVFTVNVPDYVDRQNDIFRIPSIKMGFKTQNRLGIFQLNPVLRELRIKKIDIIHTHSEFTVGLIGKIAAKKLKIPLIHTTHMMWEDYSKHYILNGMLISAGMIKRMMRSFLKNVTVIIAPSIKAKKYCMKLVPHIPIVHIDNGIDELRFKSAEIKKSEIKSWRGEFAFNSEDTLIIFVGRIGKEKRSMELFNAVLPVLESNTGIKMIFVGDGPLLSNLRKKVKHLKMDQSVIFTGFVNWEVTYRFYVIADVFVTVSLSEIQPMTVIEAVMCGLPVLVRNDDSFHDLVQNNVNGYRAETDEEFTQKLMQLINDEMLLQKYSEGSRVISKKYTADNHVGIVENLYERILNLHHVRTIDK